jgi:hypothetical protein
MVLSVPNKTKCRSGVETKENFEVVGALVTKLALPESPYR